MQGALRRSLVFTLTPEQMYRVIVKPCVYCGGFGDNCTLDFAYSGLDRTNNNVGYIEGNVVACCKLCNRMKGKLTGAEFIAHIKRIAKQ